MGRGPGRGRGRGRGLRLSSRTGHGGSKRVVCANTTDNAPIATCKGLDTPGVAVGALPCFPFLLPSLCTRAKLM